MGSIPATAQGRGNPARGGAVLGQFHVGKRSTRQPPGLAHQGPVLAVNNGMWDQRTGDITQGQKLGLCKMAGKQSCHAAE